MCPSVHDGLSYFEQVLTESLKMREAARQQKQKTSEVRAEVLIARERMALLSASNRKLHGLLVNGSSGHSGKIRIKPKQ